MINQKELKQILEYNPDAGVFIWAKPRKKVIIGSEAGCLQPDGYVYIGILGTNYSVHRLAFLYMTGEFPENHVDHINRVKNDNRWINLRKATPTQNQRNRNINKNNTSFINGVGWDKSRNKWKAYITVNSVLVNLGRSDDKFEAICMRKSAEIKKWGVQTPH